MTVAAIRSAIKAVMLTVPDVGVVHEFERYVTDLAGLKALYLYAPLTQLRGWYVRRLNTRESGKLHNRSVETIRWRIQGFMALSDANQSELQMDDLVEALRDVFRVNNSLNGTVDQCSIPGANGNSGECALQLEDTGPVMFAGVLCHATRLGLTTTRYLTAPVI